MKEYIPLKNQLGEIVDTELYTCDQPEGYFSVKLIQRLIVHKECESFAQFLRCRALSGIHFEEIDYFEPLTADDVEMLTDSYFLYSNELLMGFYRNGLLPDELLEEYDLEYLSYGKANESYAGYDFPEDPGGNLASLKKHVQTQWQNPIWIVPETVQRTVYKGKTGNGKTFDLSVSDTREGALHIYTPEGVHGLCFCQMCTKLKAYGFMEVNNIQLKPEYYFPQLRVALCLECSKRFEALRNKEHFREEFIKAIKQFKLQDQGTVDIPIENERIKFTAKHLAEIQEILKRMPKTSGK